MDANKEGLKWLLEKTEKCSERYIESEQFIMGILNMKWYQRIFLSKKIITFLKNRSKYNF